MNMYVQLEERLQHGDIMIKFRQFNEHLTMCHITNDDSSCWAYSRCVSVVLSKNEWESKREKKKLWHLYADCVKVASGISW